MNAPYRSTRGRSFDDAGETGGRVEGQVDEHARPFGVTVLGGIAILSAIGVGLAGLGLNPSGIPASSGFGLFCLEVVVLGTLSPATAYGLLARRPWGWPVAVLSWAAATGLAVIALFAHTIDSDLTVAPLVLA